MLHVSDSLPSQWVVLLEGGLVVLGLLLGAASFRPLMSAGATTGRALRAMGRRPVLSMSAIALASGLFLAAQTALVGAPLPHVVDEWSYLLAADTFAHNRLANPPHPMGAHLESPHVLQRPSYASKYPPAQGIVLAIGQVAFGHPARALWLSAALLVVAIGWMLLGFVPPAWAVFGAFLVALRLGAGSYWNQTYWGGSIAAIGGALLLGALRRLWDRPRVLDAVLLALGVAVLANSRPFEGMLVSIPAALALALALARGGMGRGAWLRVVVPVVIVLAATGLWMTRYNRAVTGSAFELPHDAHARSNRIPHFVWQATGTPGSPPLYVSRDDGTTRRGPWATPESSGWHRMTVTLFFFLGIAGAVPLLVTRAAIRDPWVRFAAATFLVVASGHFFILPWFAHYAAPALAACVLLGVQGQRLLRASRYRRGDSGPASGAGRSWFAAACLVQVAVFAAQIPAYRADAASPSRQRARIAWEMEHRPGRHLLLLSHPASYGNDWTYNRADVDKSKVVWANDLGDDANEELLAYYPDRTVWRVEVAVDAKDPVPVLVRGAAVDPTS
jgi:hypothetical protein